MNTDFTGQKPETDKMDREFIQAIREGIDIVRMVFFVRMRDHILEHYTGNSREWCQMLTGAILNELFGTRNPEPRFVSFAQEHSSLIEKELRAVPENFGDLLIPITDALRMHFLCNHQENMPDYSLSVLARAKDYGILLEERNVPLPKGFMEMVYRIGKAYGLVVEQAPA